MAIYLDETSTFVTPSSLTTRGVQLKPQLKPAMNIKLIQKQTSVQKLSIARFQTDKYIHFPLQTIYYPIPHSSDSFRPSKRMGLGIQNPLIQTYHPGFGK